MLNRQQDVHNKGFNIVDSRRLVYEGPEEYSKIKVGTKTLDDATLNFGSLKKVNRNYGDKELVLRAIATRNLPLMREISDFFYDTNGIYSNVCNHFANLYRYDWYTVPEILDENVKNEKVLKDFNNILSYLDNSHIKKLCGDIATEVITRGAYYGYILQNGDRLVLQQLPVNYCRSVLSVCGDCPVVEMDMRFFDVHFKDINYRLNILKMFPKDIQRGYVLYKQGKLPGCDNVHQTNGSWYTLDPASTVRFCINRSERPLFINAIPALIDLDEAQDLDRRKQMQDLLKIVIQQLPLDKNGDLIFDVDEARDIHNNAVEMLQHAIGVDVLTTFADIQVETLSDKNTATSKDDLEKMERSVYNQFGTSKELFNSDGQIALNNSILDDESSMRSLLLQLGTFFDRVTQSVYTGNKKKYNFRLYMLETTQYNYKDLSKMYKEHVQLGYSKMLPQIALGHSQSSIIHTAYFENEVLSLSEIMIPPMMSSTMNAESLQQLGKGGKSNNTSSSNSTEEKSAGRPEKDDSEKSAKTLQNKESMS